MTHIGLKKLYKEIENVPGQEYVKIPATQRTPEILLDRTGTEAEVHFLGRSLPDDARGFYNPILQWIDEYFSQPHPKTFIRFKLEYFNTSSSKMLLQIIKKLEKLENHNKNVAVEWCYMEDDEDILESGRTFQELTSIPFNFVSYQ
ncbi:MAG: DUF1987 domain-containing protein [Bacteroidales bacterium]